MLFEGRIPQAIRWCVATAHSVCLLLSTSILLAPDLRRDEVRGLRLTLWGHGLLCVPGEHVLQFLQFLRVLLGEVRSSRVVVFQVEEFDRLLPSFFFGGLLSGSSAPFSHHEFPVAGSATAPLFGRRIDENRLVRRRFALGQRGPDVEAVERELLLGFPAAEFQECRIPVHHA